MRNHPNASIELTNSVYLANNNCYTPDGPGEEGLLYHLPINESTHKIAAAGGVRHRENNNIPTLSDDLLKLMQTNVPFSQSSRFEDLKEYGNCRNSVMSPKRPIQKVFKEVFTQRGEEYQQCQMPIDESWRKRRDVLAAKAETRRREKSLRR